MILVVDAAEAEAMLDDPDMKPLAEEELPQLRQAIPEAEKSLQLALLPKDAADAKPAMMEIRPGTGGDEAALFAGDLLRMYTRYCEARGWRLEIIDLAETELGGIKEVTARIEGERVFARMKFESGALDFLLKRYRRDVSSLLSAIEVLDSESLAAGRASITVPFLKRCFVFD